MARINCNPNHKRSKTQKQLILELLQSGATLTPLDAWQKVGTTKLATRISELISDGHTEIQKEQVKVKTAAGYAYVMSYFIDPKLKLID